MSPYRSLPPQLPPQLPPPDLSATEALALAEEFDKKKQEREELNTRRELNSVEGIVKKCLKEIKKASQSGKTSLIGWMPKTWWFFRIAMPYELANAVSNKLVDLKYRTLVNPVSVNNSGCAFYALNIYWSRLENS